MKRAHQQYSYLSESLNLSDFLRVDQDNKKFYEELTRILGKDERLEIPNDTKWKCFRKKKHCILLQVTKKCNSNCNVCYMANEDYEEITVEDLECMLRKIGKNKVILLEGGEPTARGDIFQMIKLIRKSGNIPEIYTNGLKLADLKYVKKLKKSGLSQVHFSFDGFREDIYEKLRGDKNQFYLKLKALENLQKVGIKTILSSTIAYGINDDQIPELLKFCVLSVYRNDFIKGLRFFGAVPYGRFRIHVERFMKTIDIIKVLEKVTNKGIRREYFLEFKRFLMNVNRLLDKFGIYIPYGYASPTAIFKVTTKESANLKIDDSRNVNDGGIIEIKELIDLNELKIINDALEKYNLPSLMYHLLKNKKLLKYVLSLIQGKLKEKILEGGNLLLSVGLVITPITFRGLRTDSWDMRKITERIIFGSRSLGSGGE